MNIDIEVMLEGGYIIQGRVTKSQFSILMDSLHEHRGGSLRIDEGKEHEVLVVVDKIVAVRLRNVGHEAHPEVSR